MAQKSIPKFSKNVYKSQFYQKKSRNWFLKFRLIQFVFEIITFDPNFDKVVLGDLIGSLSNYEDDHNDNFKKV